ncbi:MAG: LytTR family transcriptional regulator DNA-binding domain-containing protein [Phenylobacterium sp.]|uniref:LytTR family DNA-binding domain-containing protein n=1 Tax=Phenylobacterium sp. TaxID=1871053 RepID=UPI0025D991EA|nr:LytTR family DNA-binding domain-containing protein [Phenylobacterium sp.]MCA6297708.1 LytTR family transcriptional regulator DNA-binding domain-containing protein [Phenylobacterium sp.]
MTPPLRKPPGSAIHEAWTVEDYRRVFAITLGLAAAVGAFLGFVGAFGLEDFPLGVRLAYMIPVAVLTGAIGLGGYLLAGRLAPGLNRWLRAILGGLLTFAPIGVIVWLTAGLIPGAHIPPSALLGYIGTSLVVSVSMSLLSVAVNPVTRDRREPGLSTAPSRFLERLPIRLRGAEIWAVEAEDHYLRVHTSAGQDLILLRMADAVAELEGQEGMQVHRSWWVARAGIADARRGDGRATLTLKDGAEAPVSRTYAAELRRRGWV